MKPLITRVEPFGPPPKSFFSSLLDGLFDDIEKDIEKEEAKNSGSIIPHQHSVINPQVVSVPFSPSFMHPPHVVSFHEFFKSPIKTGPHPKFADQGKDKKKEEPKKDDKK